MNNYEKILSEIKTKKLEELITNTLKKIETVEDDTKKFLKSKSWWKNIHTNFQLFIDKTFPNTFVVSFPSADSVNSLKLLNSIFMPNEKNKIIKKEMAVSACHDNCELLKMFDKSLVVYTGYCLSDDGLWRNHSWLIDKNNNIIETTEERLIYLGYALK